MLPESDNVSFAKKAIVYAFSLTTAFLLLNFVFGLSLKQSIATTLVLGLVLGTVLFWDIRLAFALIGSFVLISSGLLGIEKFIEFSSLNIILFLAGMMLFIGYLEKRAFFEYLIFGIMKHTGGGGLRLVFIILFFSALFAAIVDEVTSILFMLSIVLSLCARLRINPIPFVMMTVFATNIGSSATAIGNPVGVMIALSAKLSFADFLEHATLTAFFALIAMFIVVFFIFKKEILEFAERSREIAIGDIFEGHIYGNKSITALFFIIVFGGLVLHTQIEQALGLEKNAMLLGVALGAGGIALLAERREARHFVETKIDWWTLFFFMLLFASVGALEQSGVMEIAAKAFAAVFGADRGLAAAAIMLISGLLSAALDNVLAVAVFIPLVHDLQSTAIAGTYLWWSLLFGATLFGNLTMIGSTANIIALGILEKRGLPRVSFFQWLDAGIKVTIPTALVAFVIIYLQYLA
ncbi:MAG: SLC13 family permease [Candidatus Micrarchaeota archaeon]|nr:SLC13 family permease [Candidatus Micrarchaeota archaeon]